MGGTRRGCAAGDEGEGKGVPTVARTSMWENSVLESDVGT